MKCTPVTGFVTVIAVVVLAVHRSLAPNGVVVPGGHGQHSWALVSGMVSEVRGSKVVIAPSVLRGHHCTPLEAFHTAKKKRPILL